MLTSVLQWGMLQACNQQLCKCQPLYTLRGSLEIGISPNTLDLCFREGCEKSNVPKKHPYVKMRMMDIRHFGTPSALEEIPEGEGDEKDGGGGRGPYV